MAESGLTRLTAVAAERRAALRVVRRQGLVAIALALFSAPLGLGTSVSMLLGGGVGVLATLVFALALFRSPEGASAARVAWSFYLGQAVKVGLTVALLAIVFRAHVPAPWAVLVGYLATQAAYWFSPRGPASRH